MIPALLHHSRASRAVRIAQLAAVGLTAVVAVVLVLGPRSGPRDVPPLTLPTPGTKPLAASTEAKPQERIDVPALADRFSQLGNSPKPEVKASPTEETKPEVVPTEESVRFLGVLTEPGRRLALLKVNDRQRLLGPGEKFEALRVVEVGLDFAIIEDDHGPRRLTKGERQGAAVTYTGAGSLGAAPNAFNPGAANGALDAAQAAKRARAGEHLARQVQTVGGVVNSSVNVRGAAENGGGEQQP